MKNKNEKELPALIEAVKGEIEIEKPIREWLEYANIIFANNSKKVTSLKEFTENFYNAYMSFKEDYDKIEKLNIGNLVNVLYFSEDENSRHLELVVENDEEGTIKPDGFIYLNIIERDGKFRAYFTNSQNHNRKISEITDVNPSVLKGYLDVFSKHKEIFNLYLDFHRQPELACGYNHYLYVRVNAKDDSLVDGLDGIEFTIQNYPFMNTCYIVHIDVDLTNGININYKNCSVLIDDRKESLVGRTLYSDALGLVKFPTSRLTKGLQDEDEYDDDEEIDTNRKK